MKLGIDIMGGDYAPRETVFGAILAEKELPSHVKLTLIGRKSDMLPLFQEHGVDSSKFEIIDTPDVIEMAESPTRAISQKPHSSIVVGFNLLKSGAIDAFASAGNTGAMMVAAMYTVKTIPGIIRPSITSVVPKEDGSMGIILDVGINADCKPDILYQFGVLGSIYAKYVYNIHTPRVALLNIGEEEEKGNLVTQAAFQLMKHTKDFHFIGNIEGREIFNNKADVIVCDGFTGNVVIKEGESIFELVKKRGIKDDYFERFNYEIYGGTPILGINANVIIGHGISNARAVKNMILLSHEVAQARIAEKIKQALN